MEVGHTKKQNLVYLHLLYDDFSILVS